MFLVVIINNYFNTSNMFLEGYYPSYNPYTYYYY